MKTKGVAFFGIGGQPPADRGKDSIMDEINDNDFDSPQQVRAMRRRQAELGLRMQQLGVQGLLELEQRGNLTAAECAELLAEGLKLENAAAPTVSKKRH